MIIIMNQTYTVGCHIHFYMFIKLKTTKTKNLLYILSSHAIPIIITTYYTKSSMNQHKSSTWNILYTFNPIRPKAFQKQNKFKLWIKQ